LCTSIDCLAGDHKKPTHLNTDALCMFVIGTNRGHILKVTQDKSSGKKIEGNNNVNFFDN
jgi:hypothetical protein